LLNPIFLNKSKPSKKGKGAGKRAFYLQTTGRGITAELRNGENK
jgi:hypothetical protein